MLALVQWMNPQWVWALPLAALLPLLAHLLSRRMGRLALFPAVRFVQKAMALQSRWYWPRHWLMLLLRMLILAAVVGALAQPIWWEARDQASRNHQGLAVVLVLDASASMQRSAQGSSLFEIARSQAIKALQTLDPSRDRAMVIILDAAPRPVLPRMSANFSAMINELATLNPTWENGDLSAALTLAARPTWDPGDLTATAPVAVHLYSDMQLSQWPGDAQLRGTLQGKELVLHAVGKAQGNLALHHAMITPAMPVRGQRATVWVEVANYSASPSATHSPNTPSAGAPAGSASPVDVNVIMTAQGQRQVRRVKLSPRGTARVSFPWLPQQTGAAKVELSLEAIGSSGSAAMVDALELDNHLGRFVQVARARHVALVTAADTDNAATAAYYFKRALTPASDLRANDVQLRVWTPAAVARELSQTSPNSWPACVVMVETQGLPAEAREALTHYMQRGGGVWWVIDSQAAAQSLATWQTENGPVSPVLSQAGDQVSLEMIQRVDGMAHVGSGAYNETELAIFDGPSRSALQSPYFQSTFEGTLAPGATGLLYYAHLLPGDGSDHPPMLAYQAIGPGRLAVMTAATAPSLSPLVKGPVFVPLVHQMVRSLSPQFHATRNPVVAEAAEVVLAALPGDGASGVAGEAGGATAIYLRRPDDSRSIELKPLKPLNTSSPNSSTANTPDEPTMVQLPAAAIAGSYSVHAQSDSRLLGGVYVELAAGESDLAQYHPQAGTGTSGQNDRDLATTTGGAVDADASADATGTPQAAPPVIVMSNEAGSGADATAIREDGVVLWPYLLMLAAILVVAESLWCGVGSAGRVASGGTDKPDDEQDDNQLNEQTDQRTDQRTATHEGAVNG